MKISQQIIAVMFVVSTFGTAASAQERTASRQGFELAPNSGKKILVFRPTVKVGAQSTGGVFEPNAQWTDDARRHLSDALLAKKATFGNEVIFAAEPLGEDAIVLQEHMALFSTVASSVIQYQFFAGNRLPTKKRDNNKDIFDWSLGAGVSTLPGASQADYGLFIHNEDQYGSTGRKILQVVALFGPGIAVKSGEHKGYAALVDLKTGDILWLNADGAMGGDVRGPEGAAKRVSQLLEGIPGGILPVSSQ